MRNELGKTPQVEYEADYYFFAWDTLNMWYESEGQTTIL